MRCYHRREMPRPKARPGVKSRRHRNRANEGSICCHQKVGANQRRRRNRMGAKPTRRRGGAQTKATRGWTRRCDGAGANLRRRHEWT